MFNTLMLVGALMVSAPQEENQDREGPPLVSLEELTLKHYTPEHVELYELYELATRMVGRSVFVKERGGYVSQPVSNMSVLGESLVLYDTESYVSKMLGSLKELDQPGASGASGQRTNFSTLEYTPRFISLEVVSGVLGSFQRNLFDGSSNYPNISFARERGLLIVRETESRLEEIRALLQRIDTPKPQVLITCHLIRGGKKAGDLPAELGTHLEKLVPGFQFEQVAFGMLQSAVVPESMVTLKLETNYGEKFELGFSPVALDSKTSSLSVTNCTLLKDRVNTGGMVAAGPSQIRVFSTDTIFRGNEYTVLGASGVEPIFVVIRVTPMGV